LYVMWDNLYGVNYKQICMKLSLAYCSCEAYYEFVGSFFCFLLKR
jgi:hypothetical protein